MKKSSQSKRLAKKREKEKKQVPDGDNNKFDNNDYEVRCICVACHEKKAIFLMFPIKKIKCYYNG